MSDRIPEADRAVDEQKRRARRRLVGAVVLAAAAAVILPMLLEKDPQPLGEDVSVQIPPVDEGKFVNRLTRSKTGDAPTSPKSDAKGAAKPEAPKPEPAKPDAAKTETPDPGGVKAASAEAPPVKPAGVAASSAAPVASAPAPSSPGSVPEQSAPAVPATKPAPDGASSAPSNPPSAPAGAAPGADTKSAPPAGFAVQLAAFSDDKGANAYANKVRKAGYAAAHVEAVDTAHGKLWRVRVGGFVTRAEAEAARVKLEAKGFGNGMVAPAR